MEPHQPYHLWGALASVFQFARLTKSLLPWHQPPPAYNLFVKFLGNFSPYFVIFHPDTKCIFSIYAPHFLLSFINARLEWGGKGPKSGELFFAIIPLPLKPRKILVQSFARLRVLPCAYLCLKEKVKNFIFCI